MRSTAMFSEPGHGFLPYPFKPVVDDYLQKPFFPKDPWDAIREGDFNQVGEKLKEITEVFGLNFLLLFD